MTLSYSVITPVRDEAGNLPRLAAALESQTVPPTSWVIVDTGSGDGTRGVVDALCEAHDWVVACESPAGAAVERGAPIVEAFHAGLAATRPRADVVVKVDADVSMPADHFERLLAEFSRDPRLGIAGGSCYEQDDGGAWRERHGTGAAVWGAARAYRGTCLAEILPLEARMGWDTLDLLTAEVRGWAVRRVPDLPFLHHRPEAARDGSEFRRWWNQGVAAHYMHYRVPYLVLRAVFQSRRGPAALGLVGGYAYAALGRHPRHSDASVRAHLRRRQRLTVAPARAAEALRRRRHMDARGATAATGDTTR
jgi:glycosyltransferase involved in cell wall biosynthesis